MNRFPCRRCHQPFSGFRCPHCGMPTKAHGCLCIFGPVLLGLLLITILTPGETVPRVTVTGGVATYVFQSWRAAILWPAGALLLLLACTAYGFLFRVKPPPPEPRPRQTGILHLLALGGRGIGTVVILGCYAMLAILFLYVTLLVPLTRFRSAEVSDDAIVCYCLYRSIRVPLDDFRDAHVKQKASTTKGTDYITYTLVLDTKSGHLYSVDIRRRADDPDVPHFSALMDQCVNDILARRNDSVDHQASKSVSQ